MPEAFEAPRGSRFYRICFLVGQLKYQSTSACPPPRIFAKLASCKIRVQWGKACREKKVAKEYPVVSHKSFNRMLKNCCVWFLLGHNSATTHRYSRKIQLFASFWFTSASPATFFQILLKPYGFKPMINIIG